MTTRVLWFRRDLRLADNHALTAAMRDDSAVVAVYVHEPTIGPAASTWLNASLGSLRRDLSDRGATLLELHGPIEDAVTRVAREAGAAGVHCSRVWTPDGLAEETRVRRALERMGGRLEVAEGSLLVTPEELVTGSGGPYRVFTPYHRAWLGAWRCTAPEPVPRRIPAPPATASYPAETRGGRIDTAAAAPCAPWGSPGERGAAERLRGFAEAALLDYASGHDLPGIRGTSELSAHLAFGELSPRQVVHGVSSQPDDLAAPFIRQLAWREFAHHVLHHFPQTAARPLQMRFEEFPWSDDPRALEAWQGGLTGFPMVDAGIRQLVSTGWMHNRVRLLAGSVLTKHLLVPWQTGAAFFEARLADFDQASNVFNWQWVAGCGADAAPYFRIFSPARQGSRFDADGTYVRRWVPELAALPNRWIHSPWEAPADVLASAGVRLGRDYPQPIVDHAEARLRALAAYEAIRR